MIVVFTWLSCLSSVQAQDVSLSIVGNLESVPDEMNMSLLKSVLMGEKQRWDDGRSIKIALMKTNTPVGKSTCDKIYDMTGNELNKYFLALVFQGKVKAPTFFNSIDELERYIAQTPGAIGVSQQTKADQVKIIIIEGKNAI
jgi:F0F1-type ATP synthase beta subunit